MWNVISTSVATGNVCPVQSGLCKQSAKQYIALLKKVCVEQGYVLYGATELSFVVSYGDGLTLIYSIVKEN